MISNENYFPHNVQDNFIVSAISAKRLWCDVDEKEYLQTLQADGDSLQKIWDKEVRNACQSIQNYFPSQAMEIAAAKFQDFDYSLFC